METRRLKNIAILILLLLNVFLLGLLGYQRLQARQTQRETRRQLTALFAANQITLEEGIDLSLQPLPPMTLSRQEEAERSVAACLLGGEPQVSGLGGVTTYTTEFGSIQFRAGGQLDGDGLSLPVDDPEAFLQDFCRQFGYSLLETRLSQGSGSASAVLCASDVPVYGCSITFTFRSGVLTAAAGAYVSLTDAAADASRQLDCVTALVRFLDYRNANGAVCSQITGLACVYTLRGASAARLLPSWQVCTDTFDCLVDCATGAVTRQ